MVSSPSAGHVFALVTADVHMLYVSGWTDNSKPRQISPSCTTPLSKLLQLKSVSSFTYGQGLCFALSNLSQDSKEGDGWWISCRHGA